MSPLVGASLASAFLPATHLLPGVRSFWSGLPNSFTPEVLKQWYLSPGTDPLHPIILSASAVSLLVFVIGELTSNVSSVDRLWNVLPLLHGAHLTFYPKVVLGQDLDPRMLLVFGLQCVWSFRIGINSYRRGFYSWPLGEDYRWDIVKSKIPGWAYSLLDLTFISITQNILLAAMELPVYVLLCVHLSRGGSPPLGLVDFALAAFIVFCLAVELEADNQQQRFQWKKQQAIKRGEKVPRGFVTEGLWAWARHPNFALEQLHWYLIYAFTILPFLDFARLPSFMSLSARVEQIKSFADAKLLARSVEGYGKLWNFSFWAPVAMTVLFYSSTDLTERISAGKYPEYKKYQQRVGMFNPALTILKGVWLAVTGRKAKVDKIVYGTKKLKKE